MKRSGPPKRRTPLRSKARLGRGPRGWRDAEEWHKIRAFVESRCRGRCEGRVEGVCEGRGDQAHHVRLRSQGGTNDPANLLWLCSACHAWAHAHPAQAKELGLIRSATA